jgi:hypothetical protein
MTSAKSPDDDAAPDPETSPFEGLTDNEVLGRAVTALRRANAAPLRSITRSVQWALYEQAKAELDMRMYVHVLAKIKADKADNPWPDWT